MRAHAGELGILSIVASRPGRPSNDPVEDSRVADIEGCRRGDRAAIERVFRAHAAGLERLLVRLVGPRADAEDLLQETFVAAIAAFPRFRGEASVKTWLCRIAVYTAHHHLRQRRHWQDIELDTEAVPGTEEPASEVAARRQLSAHLYGHLDRLDPKKRIALMLYVVDELPIAEVAALTGASLSATKARIFWARRVLLKRLRRDPRFGERK